MSQIKFRLKERLDEMRMRPSELARRAGIAPSSVKNLIYGKVQQPREDLIEKITKVLKVNPEYLLYGIKHNPANNYKAESEVEKLPWDSELYKKVVDIINQKLAENEVSDLNLLDARKMIDQLYSYAYKKSSSEIDADVADCIINVYLRD